MQPFQAILGHAKNSSSLWYTLCHLDLSKNANENNSQTALVF